MKFVDKFFISCQIWGVMIALSSGWFESELGNYLVISAFSILLCPWIGIYYDVKKVNK